MRIKLIESGFDTFNARFQSSKSYEGRHNALNRALHKARQKAEQIADQMGVELGRIKNINYSGGSSDPVYRTAETMRNSSDLMMNFEQTLSVSESVSVTYFIKNKEWD